MKHVQRIAGRDGRERLYLRKKGLPRVRLNAPWGSAQLAAEVEGLIAALSPQRAAPGTTRAALRAYELESAEFRNLAPSTKYEYRLILAEFDQALGALPVTVYTPAFLLQLRDRWAARGHRAANLRMQVLKNVLARPLIEGLIEVDPFARVPQVRRPPDLGEPHRIWPAGVVETVIAAALAEGRHGLARAVAIARYTGARRADLVRIGRGARQDGRFRFLSGKRRVPVDIPEDPALTRWLDGTPDAPPAGAEAGLEGTAAPARPRRQAAQAITPTTLVYNLAGRPYSEDGLARELAKLIGRLRDRGAIDAADYDLHGLRHTRGVELALAGCTDPQGAAQLGHTSPHSFAPYRRQADRLRMAEDAADKVARLRGTEAERAGVKPGVKKV